MDPQRPYAQLLTPIAKSIKLLRRAQHHKLVNTREFNKNEAVLKVWQKLSAKGIAACPAHFVADLFVFLETGEYIGILVNNFQDEQELHSLCQQKILDGLICVHTKGEYLRVKGKFISVYPAFFDYFNVSLILALSQGLSTGQERAVSAAKFKSVGKAVQFLQLLSQNFPDISWQGFDDDDVNQMVQMLTALYRNQGQALRADKLSRHGKVSNLLDYLCEELELLETEHEGSRYVTWV